MWPFKEKEVAVVDTEKKPRIYFTVTIKLDDGEVLEFTAWDIRESGPYHNFQTTDGWREIKISAVRTMRIKYLLNQNVIPLRTNIDLTSDTDA